MSVDYLQNNLCSEHNLKAKNNSNEEETEYVMGLLRGFIFARSPSRYDDDPPRFAISAAYMYIAHAKRHHTRWLMYF